MPGARPPRSTSNQGVTAAVRSRSLKASEAGSRRWRGKVGWTGRSPPPLGHTPPRWTALLLPWRARARYANARSPRQSTCPRARGPSSRGDYECRDRNLSIVTGSTPTIASTRCGRAAGAAERATRPRRRGAPRGAVGHCDEVPAVWIRLETAEPTDSRETSRGPSRDGRRMRLTVGLLASKTGASIGTTSREALLSHARRRVCCGARTRPCRNSDAVIEPMIPPPPGAWNWLLKA